MNTKGANTSTNYPNRIDPHMNVSKEFMVCSECFNDNGLRLDAERIGTEDISACPNCGNVTGKKLYRSDLEDIAHRFFVWGSLHRSKYGAAPTIQFNQHQKTSIEFSSWLEYDIKLFEEILGIGFFPYGPRLWMIGEVEPLISLQITSEREQILQRILTEYPECFFDSKEIIYRVRKNPKSPDNPSDYDSSPTQGTGRLDDITHPVFYGSPDIQICIHECRINAEDDAYIAALQATKELRLLNLTKLIKEEGTTEFESLDMAVHMLFLAGEHSYVITRDLSKAAKEKGFDGIIYPSYFSLLRIGKMPFHTFYGISCRMFPDLQQHEESKSIPNLAIFGNPIKEGVLSIKSINRLILSQVHYEVHFGPVPFE